MHRYQIEQKSQRPSVRRRSVLPCTAVIATEVWVVFSIWVLEKYSRFVSVDK